VWQGGFGESLGKFVEMPERGWREFDLLAPGVFGIVEHDPAFLAHR